MWHFRALPRASFPLCPFSFPSSQFFLSSISSLLLWSGQNLLSLIYTSAWNELLYEFNICELSSMREKLLRQQSAAGTEVVLEAVDKVKEDFLEKLIFWSCPRASWPTATRCGRPQRAVPLHLRHARHPVGYNLLRKVAAWEPQRGARIRRAAGPPTRLRR